MSRLSKLKDLRYLGRAKDIMRGMATDKETQYQLLDSEIKLQTIKLENTLKNPEICTDDKRLLLSYLNDITDYRSVVTAFYKEEIKKKVLQKALKELRKKYKHQDEKISILCGVKT